MVCVSALLTIPFLLADFLCPGQSVNLLRVDLISSTFVASGISTIIQTGLGMRLALLQGTAFAYVPSVEAFMNLAENRCNATISDFVPQETYYEKLQLVSYSKSACIQINFQIQGSLLLSALVPIFIGCTGLVGMLTKFIGPITVTPLILLLMASTVEMCVVRMQKSWVSLVQAAALFTTILYLAELRIPIPGRKNGKFHVYRVNIFGEYPYLIAILFSWGFCALLTNFNLIAPDSEARTDKNLSMIAIRESPFFRAPYPFQFGTPKFNAGLFFAFLVSALTSVFGTFPLSRPIFQIFLYFLSKYHHSTRNNLLSLQICFQN
jgi:nucleobase transporter 1/2